MQESVAVDIRDLEHPASFLSDMVSVVVFENRESEFPSQFSG